ncbi:MAG: winged helix-turn-helix domain-containing protein [Acidobacteriota bacterium]
MRNKNGHFYEFKSFRLNLDERLLLNAEKSVSLTPKAFDVLAVLVERSGHLIEKEELMQMVWPDSFVEEANLTRIIHTLRKSLGDDGNGNKFIETVPTKGYRFVADVTPVEKDDEDKAAVVDVQQPSELVEKPAQLQPSPNDTGKPKNFIPISIVVALLLAMTVGAYLLVARRTLFSKTSRRSIAVMPFENDTNDSGSDYRVDGVTESVINQLSGLSGLRVIARDSVFRYKGKEIQPTAVARELDVEALVTGNIKQVAGQVVINVNLVDANDGRQLWGRQFVKNSFDIIATPNQISEAVAESLALDLTDAEKRRLSHLPTENPEAYRLYLEGRAAGQQQTPAGLMRSVELYRQAIEKDPNFALAYSEIGMRNINLGIYFQDPNETMPVAKASAEKALKLDPTLNDPHIVLGMVALLYDWNWNKAQEELTEGTSINLKSFEVFSCAAHVLQMAGKTPDADEALSRALTDDPLSVHLTTELGCNSYYARRYDQSITEYRNALDLDPQNFMAIYGLARSLNQENKYQEAIDELDRAKKFLPMFPPVAVAERSFANAKMGRRDEAGAALKTLEQMPKEVYVDPFFQATIYLGLEDNDQTFKYLERAFQARSSLMPSLANDAKWDPMRTDPRFQNLLKNVGLP